MFKKWIHSNQITFVVFLPLQFAQGSFLPKKETYQNGVFLYL